MGGQNARLTYSPTVPTIYMLCGLQGAGKTTMAGKLALMLKKQGKKPAAGRLRHLPPRRHQAAAGGRRTGGRAGIRARHRKTRSRLRKRPSSMRASYGRDPVIIDTAGRLHIDENLMEELRDVKSAVKPQRDPAGGGRHDRSGRGERGRDLQQRIWASTA